MLFSDYIAEAQNGGIDKEITDAINHVVAKAEEMQEKGTVTIQIKVTPSPDDRGIVAITPVVRSTVPSQTWSADLWQGRK